jgi:hypothetical protein
VTQFKYSFSLTPPPAVTLPPAPEARHAYPYTEFLLELPACWRQTPAQEDDTLHFISDRDGAAIVISADFYDIPDDKAQGLAEQVVASRIEALERASGGPVQLLHRAIQPHSGGVGLELSFAAETDHVHLYLGYVTSRKVLNFSMVCQPGRQAAVALFNATVPGFRPRLP